MRALVLALACLFSVSPPAFAGTRLKDIVDVEGVRENQLIGYGIVFGLKGSGDSLRNCAMLRQSIESMMERLGVNTRNANLNTKNAAAVMVTANLPPFAANGTRIDVTVSAVCDAQSLEGGTLLATPLLGADGQAYASAQGSVAVGAFTASGASGTSLTRNIPTNGRVPNGATIERELRFDLASQAELRLSLRNPDFTTATRIAGAINAFVGVDAASAMDPATVRLRRPTVADLIAAQDAESRGTFMPAWYCAAHVLGSDGQCVWKSADELRTLSAPQVIALSRLIEPLYVEGLDLDRSPAKP